MKLIHPWILGSAAVVIVGAGSYLTWANRSISKGVGPAPTTRVTSTPKPTSSAASTATPQPTPIGGLPDLRDVGLRVIKLSGSFAQGLDLDLASGYAYVGNNSAVIPGCKADPNRKGSENTLSIVDPASGRELANVPTVVGALGTQVDRERGVVYVAGTGSGTIAVHDFKTGVKKGAIEVGGKPQAFGLDTRTGILLVSDTHDGTQGYYSAVELETQKVLGFYPAPAMPSGFVVDEVRQIAYLVSAKDGSVLEIDTKTGQPKATFQAVPATNSATIAYSAKERRLFMADTQNSSSITVMDAVNHQLLGKISFSKSSLPVSGLQVDDENGLLYAALPNGDAVGVADVNNLKALATVKVDTCPYAVRLDVARGLGVATGQVDGSVSVFELGKVKKAVRK